MSLRELAQKHLATMAKPMLSQRDNPRSVPAGQTAKTPYSSRDSAVPALQNSGTTQARLFEMVGQVVPLGQWEPGGTAGTSGTAGTNGTSGTETAPMFSPAAMQREADRRNLQALRNGVTDRWCACGRLARLAWPDGNRREVWRCDDCAPTVGRA
jgi:hypothetical protein